MKTYSIIAAVGIGLFTLVVVCARGQAPKQLEPTPLVDGSVLTPHEASYAEPHMLNRGANWHHVPNADLWATYCQEEGACGQRWLYRQWHPLSTLCSMFKLPSFGKCNCSDCASCSPRPTRAAICLVSCLANAATATVRSAAVTPTTRNHQSQRSIRTCQWTQRHPLLHLHYRRHQSRRRSRHSDSRGRRSSSGPTARPRTYAAYRSTGGRGPAERGAGSRPQGGQA